MDDLQILLVEDNAGFALEVEMQLDALGYQQVYTVGDAAQARLAIEQRPPDLLLIDIRLPGESSGLDLAESIQDYGLPIIFMTAHTDPAAFERARELQPFVYLVKPFDKLTLASSIEGAVRTAAAKATDDAVPEWADSMVLKDRIYVKKNNRLERILIDEILWIRADGNYCFVQVGEKRFVIKISLRKLLSTLPPPLFAQIQKSFAVQLHHVESIDLNTNSVYINGHALPMGRSYRDELIGRINLIK